MQSACGIDPLCHAEAELIFSAVRDSGGQYYRDAMTKNTDEIKVLKTKIEDQVCVSTPKYTGRVSETALSYLKENFNEKVGRYPTTEEEFALLYEFPVSTSDNVYSSWQATIDNTIIQNYIGTTGPEAIYMLNANSDPTGSIHSIIVNGSNSKNVDSYLWHMVHAESTASSVKKSTPPAGGMMHIDGYLRVQNVNQKYDYIVIGQSFLVNSCTTTICEIEK